jgi:hypothetical protein
MNMRSTGDNFTRVSQHCESLRASMMGVQSRNDMSSLSIPGDLELKVRGNSLQNIPR